LPTHKSAEGEEGSIRSLKKGLPRGMWLKQEMQEARLPWIVPNPGYGQDNKTTKKKGQASLVF